jgi:hypothetical protein
MRSIDVMHCILIGELRVHVLVAKEGKQEKYPERGRVQS